MRICFLFIVSLFFLLVGSSVRAQRNYAQQSVLRSGIWYRLAVQQPGVYRVDAAMLSKMGISLPLSSAQLRLYGNGGEMLPEQNSASRQDDLRENAILVEDGGDGSFSGQDYFLFYASGPHTWAYDSLSGRFRFRKNIYTDSAWYFLTVGGAGRRIPMAPTRAGTSIISEGDDFFVQETDEVNFLQSGKEWYGEAFGSGYGRVTTRDIEVPVKNIVSGSRVQLYTDVLARSIGANSRFDVLLNGAIVQQLTIPSLTGAAYEPVGTPVSSVSALSSPASALKLTLTFAPGTASAQGWLNKVELNVRRRLDMSAPGQLFIRDRSSVGRPSVRYSVENTPVGTRVWEISRNTDPVEQPLNRQGATIQFGVDASVFREYVAFNTDRLLTPVPGPFVPNQNIHAAASPSYIVITHNSLIAEAQRLSRYHQQKGLNTLVVDVQQVFNEFSSGSPDPTAIRDLVKMFYDRAGGDSLKRPRYLLLFGDASYDYKNRISGNTNLVPAYASDYSLDMLTSYTSDDYFGFLDDYEDVNSSIQINLLDIGIGRIPASTVEEARAFVDKLERYATSFGPWRNQISFVADDEDQNLHLNDAELMAATVSANAPQLNPTKLYLDAFPQESGAGGARYPLVNQAINRRIFNGNLIWNYSGHGGSKRLAEEAVLEENMVAEWQNPNKLPLFITATCDFAPYDNPHVRSLGEQLLLRPKTGAIALMTTTRAVFAYANRIINANYLATALAQQPNGRYLSLGDAVRRTKNHTYQTVTDELNTRKFTLLGDPALVLGFPEHQVVSTSVNGVAIAQFSDTLRALNKYTITGEVRDRNGKLLSDFNGMVYPSFYDKAQQRSTLANDPGSVKGAFDQQQQMIYNGKAVAENGRFSFSFIVPKDIDLRNGKAKLSYYADNGRIDAAGMEQNWYAGGLGNQVKDDREGPKINAFLNDVRFRQGGIVSGAPLLIVKLSDSSGLNTVGTGIGHDMVAILDENNTQLFVLNDYYEAEDGSYQKGIITFLLPPLEEGWHKIKIRAWDVFNNPSEYVLHFEVVNPRELKLNEVMSYPNPFTQSTRFSFEHNRIGEVLKVSVRLFTGGGKWLKTIEKTIKATGNRFEEIEWDGADASGAVQPSGLYVYQLIVRDENGRQGVASGKLVRR